MNSFKKSLRSSNGITLIALVITIIVLLILAGISISMLSGDNSILQKATTAKTETEKAQIRERIQVAYHSALISGQGKITEDLLITELTNEFGERDTTYTLTDNESQWNVAIIGTDISENIPKPSNLDEETPIYGIQEDGSFITAPGEQPTDGQTYPDGSYGINTAGEEFANYYGIRLEDFNISFGEDIYQIDDYGWRFLYNDKGYFLFKQEDASY